MKVALLAFHGDVGPLVVHSWEMTSMSDDGFLMVRAWRDEDERM